LPVIICFLGFFNVVPMPYCELDFFGFPYFSNCSYDFLFPPGTYTLIPKKGFALTFSVGFLTIRVIAPAHFLSRFLPIGRRRRRLLVLVLILGLLLGRRVRWPSQLESFFPDVSGLPPPPPCSRENNRIIFEFSVIFPFFPRRLRLLGRSPLLSFMHIFF